MNARGMKRNIGAVVVLALAITAAPALSPAQTAGRITGTVTLFGCRPGAQLRVLAYDITGLKGEDPAPRAVHAIVSPMRESHMFAFEFDGLPTNRVFEVGGSIPDEVCDRVVWDSEAGRLAVPGSSPPIIIRGYALRSKLEVRNERSDDPEIEWLGADLAATSSGNTRRVLRWTTSHPTTGGVLQVSTEPFLPAADPCADPPGLVHSQPVTTTTGQWSETRVDLGAVFDQIPQPAKKFVQGGAGLFARVVPVVIEGTVRNCDPVDTGASGHAIFSFRVENAPKDEPVVLPTIEYGNNSERVYYGSPAIDKHPHEFELCFQVRKLHKVNMDQPTNGDWSAFSAGLWHGTWLFPGQVFCHVYVQYSGKSSGFLDIISDLVTGVIDGVAWFVNTISDMYNSIKTFVVQRVVDALDFVGNNIVGYDFCNSTCETLVVAAVDYGMAMMGLPPSLPNFDQLTDMGVDYLAAQVAEQVGVPPEVVAHAYEIAAESAKKMKQSRGMGVPGPYFSDWLVEYKGLSPGALILRVRQMNPATKTPDALYIRSTGDIFLDALLPLPKNMPQLFNTGFPPVPEPFLVVPVSLMPDVDVIPKFSCSPKICTPPWHNTVFNAFYRLEVGSQSCVFTDGLGTRFDVNVGDWLSPNTLQLHYIDAQWNVEPTEHQSWFGPKHDGCPPYTKAA